MNRKQKNCSNSRLARLITRVLALCVLLAGACLAQNPPAEAMGLYRQLLHPVFRAADVHHIRGVEIDREDLHIVLVDGVIGLMEPVAGHVTGAFFEGEGQILLIPPDRAERTSLALFTRSGVLDTQFQTACLRFFDDKLVQALQRGFRPESDGSRYIEKWQNIAEAISPMDATDLLQAATNSAASSQMLHMRAASATLGIFDVVFNTNAPEQIRVAQPARANSLDFYNVWTEFRMRSEREAEKSGIPRAAAIHASDFRIDSRITPPTDLAGEAELTITAQRPGQRTILLQLSRYLKVSAASMDGRPVEFIQNEAVSGSDLDRRGDDLVALVLPTALEQDRPVKLLLKYSGPVMFDVGGELIYVGSRGTWYPSPGPSFANFDLTFEYPPGWTLAATGRRVSSTTQNGIQTSRFLSDKPIPHAGFNIGRFETATARSKNVVIDVYAAKTAGKALTESGNIHPDPSQEAQQIADQATGAVGVLSSELGPFPYSHLEISQLPAALSQSWPGLIYLSSLAFLTDAEREAIGIRGPFSGVLLGQMMLDHEIAHQWWGDAVDSLSYRDEWIIEAVANYCAAAMLEREDPAKMRIVLEHYRSELLKKTENGILSDAGPVTLGGRLTSSMFPNAYEVVVYGRGTWLVHMLRTMLRQASGRDDDTVFFAALHNLLSKSAGGKISTRNLQHAFEQVLPPSLFYEGQRSLDWFFDSWVNSAAIPRFSLEGVHLSTSGERMQVKGVVHEELAAKDMVTPVPLYSVDQGGRSHFLAFVFVDEEKTEFELNAPAGTKDVLLDPQNTILRR